MARGDLSLIDEVIAETRRRSASELPPNRTSEVSAAANEGAADAAVWPSTLEDLCQASEEGVRELLQRASSDDIVCMVAEGSDGLRQCIEAHLDEASLQWLRQHLDVWTPTTRRYRDDCQQRLLAITTELVSLGRLQRRMGEEGLSESEGEDADLVGMLGTMIEALRRQGRSAATLLAAEECDPLLALGLELVSQGVTAEHLHDALEAPAQALRAQYARRLVRIRTALCIAADGGSEADLRMALRTQGL